MKHEFLDDEGETYEARLEGVYFAGNDIPVASRVISGEILRLAARVQELEGDEATNRYMVESLRRIREALQAAGLWTKRENGVGGTGDCAVEAIAAVAAVADVIEDNGRLPEADSGLTLPEKVRRVILYAEAGNEYGIPALEKRIAELEAIADAGHKLLTDLQARHPEACPWCGGKSAHAADCAFLAWRSGKLNEALACRDFIRAEEVASIARLSDRLDTLGRDNASLRTQNAALEEELTLTRLRVTMAKENTSTVAESWKAEVKRLEEELAGRLRQIDGLGTDFREAVRTGEELAARVREMEEAPLNQAVRALRKARVRIGELELQANLLRTLLVPLMEHKEGDESALDILVRIIRERGGLAWDSGKVESRLRQWAQWIGAEREDAEPRGAGALVELIWDATSARANDLAAERDRLKEELAATLRRRDEVMHQRDELADRVYRFHRLDALLASEEPPGELNEIVIRSGVVGFTNARAIAGWCWRWFREQLAEKPFGEIAPQMREEKSKGAPLIVGGEQVSPGMTGPGSEGADYSNDSQWWRRPEECPALIPGDQSTCPRDDCDGCPVEGEESVAQGDEDLRISRLELLNRRLREASKAVLRGFDDKVFIRDTAGDSEAGWSFKLVPYLKGLADLQMLCGDEEPQEPETDWKAEAARLAKENAELRGDYLKAWDDGYAAGLIAPGRHVIDDPIPEKEPDPEAVRKRWEALKEKGLLPGG